MKPERCNYPKQHAASPARFYVTFAMRHKVWKEKGRCGLLLIEVSHEPNFYD